MRRTLLFLGALALPLPLAAQSAPQPVVTDGLNLLVAGKCEDAMRGWTSKWKSDEDALKAEQLVNSCAVLSKLGPVHGYDVLRTLDVTPYLQRVYVVLRGEVEPIYMMILAYAPDETHWKMQTVNWNTDPDKVIPASILPPQHPDQ